MLGEFRSLTPAVSSTPAAGDGRSLDELVAELEEHLIERDRFTGRDDSQVKTANQRIDELVRAILGHGRYSAGDEVAGTTLIKPIGHGNFATVWLAKVPKTGQFLATKIFHLDRLAEGVMLWRFRRSIRAMQRLNETNRRNPHVVRLHAVDASTLAFSMEYLSEGNLEDIAKRGWTLERKVSVMLALCEAVVHAHASGIIHRDIKPANVVLNEERQPVLTDFDIADIKFVTKLSMVEGGLGTPIFAAPEQLEDGTNATEQSDIYSLGRLLYFLLLERSPGLQIEADPSLDNLASHPRALVNIVRRATQFAPERRYRSVADLAQDLLAYWTGGAAIRAHLHAAARWLRRNRMLLLSFTVILAGVTTVAIIQRDAMQRAVEDRDAILALQAELGDLSEQFERLQGERQELDKQISVGEGNIKLLELKLESAEPAERESLQQALAEEKQRVQDLENALVRLNDEIQAIQDDRRRRLNELSAKEEQRSSRPRRKPTDRPSELSQECIDKPLSPECRGLGSHDRSVAPESAASGDERCLDEVGCLLANHPPPCCGRYIRRTKQRIAARLASVRDRVRECGQPLAGQGKLTVDLRVTVDASGVVSRVVMTRSRFRVFSLQGLEHIEDHPFTKSVERCVVEAVKHARFNRAANAVSFPYTYEF